MSDANHMARRDWSPTAQPPGSDGVMAHTPDPTKYFTNGRTTTIPRAAPGLESGASQGEMPTKINIDPANEATGEGGLTLDLTTLDQELVQQASRLGHDPASRVEAYKKLAAEKSMKVATTPPALPAITAKTSAAASQPLPVPSLAVGQAVTPPATPEPETPVALSSASTAQLMAALQMFMAKNQPTFATPTVLDPSPAPTAYSPPEPVAAAQGSLDEFIESIDMPWLTPVPQRPSVAVVFHFPHGKFKTAYHRVEYKQPCLSLIYDNRLENYSQYVPESMYDEAGNLLKLRVEVPSLRLSVDAAIADLNMTIGCLDVINLIVHDPEAEQISAAASLQGHSDLTGI